MQDAQLVRGEVLEPAGHGAQLAVGKAYRDRVDAEVAPLEVLVDRRAQLDVGQRTGALVALAPGRGDVDVPVGRRGAEALVHERLLPQPPRGLRRVALDHEIEVARVAPEQRVAHRTAHHPDAGEVGQGVEERRRAGRLSQPLEQVVAHVPATIAAHVAAG